MGMSQKSGNWVMSHGKSQRNAQLCIKREGVDIRDRTVIGKKFLVM